jgi:hypothetical protein
MLNETIKQILIIIKLIRNEYISFPKCHPNVTQNELQKKVYTKIL